MILSLLIRLVYLFIKLLNEDNLLLTITYYSYLKTKRKPGLTDETLKVLNYLFDRNLAASPVNKNNAKSGVEKKDAGKKVCVIYIK
jgi:hypothetical protein